MSTYRVNLSREDLLNLLGGECLRRHGFPVDSDYYPECKVTFFAHTVGMRVEVEIDEETDGNPAHLEQPEKP